MRRKKRVEKWLVHAIAECYDCDWEDTDFRTAQVEARKHAIKKIGRASCRERVSNRV